MKTTTLTTILALTFLPSELARAELAEPSLNQCNSAEGLEKCEVVCIRNLGDECLVAHVNFAGTKLQTGEQLFRARFQTCLNADVDLQMKELTLELNELSDAGGSGSISAIARSSASSSKLERENGTVFTTPVTASRIPRIPFEAFLNSGQDHIEVSVKLEECGLENSKQSCSISGKLVAVTNPNIRCELHDKTQSGAFRSPSLLTSPSLQNSQQPVGTIGN